MAITQKLREIGGIVNSTDLNYNFDRMQEDLQLAVEGVIFKDKYAQLETIAERNAIPESDLVQGLWAAISENGIVYEYDRSQDLAKVDTPRYFGVTDGDLPDIPYRIDGDASSGMLLRAWYICRADSRDADWKYTSVTTGETYNDQDWAIYVKLDNADEGHWVRVPKWVPIMNVTSILENNIIGKLEDLHTEDKYRIVNAINEIHDDLGTVQELTTKDKSTAVAGINELDKEMGDLDTLTTAVKSTIVGAINEVDTNVGPIENLTTKNKGNVVNAINELDLEHGDLSELHTERKDNFVIAINEVHDDLGTIQELTTDTKSNAVSAINEIDRRVGKLTELKTADKSSVINAINGLGDISKLETTTKATVVAAINELDSRAGELNDLTTTTKTNLVAAINEVDKDVGNVSTLTTTAKNDTVSAINELDKEMGTLTSLTTKEKGTIVGAINEVDKDVGNISNLSTTAKTDAVSAINELKAITDTLRGATILIGKIDLDTKDVTPAALTARALEIMGGTTVQAGWELVDKEQHEWIWNGENWQDLEQPNIYPAQNGTLGTVQGNASGDVSITNGNMTVLHSANSTKLNNQNASYYATAAQLGNISTLTTDTKTSAVAAINELNENMGDLSGLTTLTKENLVSAINTLGNVGALKTSAKNTAVDAINELVAKDTSLATDISKKADKTNVLQLDNTTVYEPSEDYHPATKKYVDSSVGTISWGSIVNNIEDQDDLMQLINERPTKLQVLTLTNTTAYTPTSNYHPATKLYVDNKFKETSTWGKITGDIADQQDLQNALLKKQDKATAWNTTNLVVSATQPEVPSEGYIIWIDLNS